MWGRVASYRRTRISLKPIAALVVCWELVAYVGLINVSFYPPPSVIAQTAVETLVDGEMLGHLRASLTRVLVSLVVGGGAGVGLGLLMGWSKRLRTVLFPYVALLYPVPKVVVLPIMFSIFGLTELSRILTMCLAVFLLVAMNTVDAVNEIDEVYFEVAVDNGAGTVGLFREVIVPGALPRIFSGLSLGFGVSFILIVVVEFIAADSGLGYVIWSSWRLFTIPKMYVALFLINLIGIVFIYGIEELGNYLTPWQQHT